MCPCFSPCRLRGCTLQQWSISRRFKFAFWDSTYNTAVGWRRTLIGKTASPYFSVNNWKHLVPSFVPIYISMRLLLLLLPPRPRPRHRPLFLLHLRHHHLLIQQPAHQQMSSLLPCSKPIYHYQYELVIIFSLYGSIYQTVAVNINSTKKSSNICLLYLSCRLFSVSLALVEYAGAHVVCHICVSFQDDANYPL